MLQSIPLENRAHDGPLPPANMRVLLLDDSNFDRARIRRLSRNVDMFIEMDEVGSIEELAVAVKKSKYDLIMIDYRLPVGDGMQALEHVLSDPNNKDAGKIMITGDTAVGTAVKALQRGCHDFVTKVDMNAEILNRAMINAVSLASERLQHKLQTEYHHKIIREGLVAALSDAELQSNVVALVRDQLRDVVPVHPQLVNIMDPGDVDLLLAGFSEDDEFNFH